MEKIEVKLDDGTTFSVNVDKYEVDDIAEQINNNSLQVVVIGDVIVQRYSILRVSLADRELDNTPEPEEDETEENLGDE